MVAAAVRISFTGRPEMVICEARSTMKRSDYIATWLANISVGALIVGGFQNVDACTRIMAVIAACIAIATGLWVNKKGGGQ